MNDIKRVLIAESSYIISDGLTKILSASPHFEVLAPLHDIECLKGRMAVSKPDLLLINPALVANPKRQVLSNIVQEYRTVAIVAIVYQYIEQSELRMYHSLIDINEEPDHIVDILLEASVNAGSYDLPDDSSFELTRRETAVLVQIAKGLMNKEIAEKLNISIHTVISHRKNITRKTNIKSVAGLAMYALMNNFIEENNGGASLL
jgi:DNA-binding NarL/FixJ family response regulator